MKVMGTFEELGTAGVLASMILERTAATCRGPVGSIERPVEWLYDDMLACVGTGGRVSDFIGCGLDGTRTYVVVVPQQEVVAEPLQNTSELISLIRSMLSLNVKELAGALQVERPSVYAWIGGTAEPKPRNRRRIEMLCSLAREWGRLSPLPLGSLRTASDDSGASILSLLTGDTFDMSRLLQLLRAAAKKQAAERSKPGELALRERARRKGTEIATPPDAQRKIDIRTGKRISPE